MRAFFKTRFGLDQRKAKRVQSELLKIRLFVKNPPEAYELSDVSEGGLSFFYEDHGKPFPDRFEVDLFDEQDFFLSKVELKKISDDVFSEIPNEGITIRRLRGRFVNMGIAQEYDLKKYLKKIT